MKGARITNILIPVIIIFIFFSTLISVTADSGFDSRAQVEDNAAVYIFLDINPDDKEQETTPSETITYRIVVRNLGDEDIVYYPPEVADLNLPQDWVATFKPENQLFIPADKASTLLFNLTSSSFAKAKTEIKTMVVGTTSIAEAKIIPLELKTTVTQLYGIEINTLDKIIFDSPVISKSLEIEISNTGNGEDRIALEITNIPSGLSISKEADEFIIGPGSKQYLTINLYPSSILTAGVYNLNISAYRVDEKTLTRTWVSSYELNLEVVYYPDLDISYGDIVLSKYSPQTGDDVLINITVHNIGDSDARNITVRVVPVTRFGSPIEDEFDDVSIDFLGLDKSTTISVPWHVDNAAINQLIVSIDPDNIIGELDENNNSAEYNLYIPPHSPPQGGNEKSSAYEFTLVHLSAVAIVSILAGVGLASFLITESGKFGLYKVFLPLSIPLYTRVKKEEVLSHGVREEVYDYVKTHPGEHFRAILTKLGLKNGTLIHHLHTLERQEFIKSERDGPYKRFYPSGRQLTEDVLEINGIQKKILDAVKSTPGLTQKDLALMLETSAPTINYHVKALHDVRLLNIKREGKYTRCFPGESMNGWYKGGVA